jgi:putative methyltransferase (TIGR04325 family)
LRRFFSGSGPWDLWGDFSSQESALNFIKGKPNSYDDSDIAGINVDAFCRVSNFDYPVIFWLSRIIQSSTGMTDFGGHIGVKYYAYRDYLQIPNDFSWNVVDVAAVRKKGEIVSIERQASTLRFFPSVKNVPEAEILMCSGSLQYCPESIEEIVTQLPSQPEWIIINKLSVVSTREFVALENFGSSWIPFRIHQQESFTERVRALGYELVDSWEIPNRLYDVPFTEVGENMRSVGQVWRRNTA